MKRFIISLAVVVFQLIMTQVVTFIASLLLPGMGDSGRTRSLLFATILTLTFTAGVFIAGWLAIKLSWLQIKPSFTRRLFGALIGAALPLVIALLIFNKLEPGNPFFFISEITCILGFYLPGWVGKQ